jgi:hypothetical protein
MNKPTDNSSGVLIVLSLGFFIHQICRFHLRSDSNGVSITYIVLNLIVATEQFTLGLQLITIDTEGVPDGMVHTPPSAGDWLNLVQFAVVWLGHVVLHDNIPGEEVR